MRRLLNQAAQAAVKMKGSIFEITFRKLVPRLGYKAAVWAIAIDSADCSGSCAGRACATRNTDLPLCQVSARAHYQNDQGATKARLSH